MSRVSAKELLLITGWNHPKLSRALHTVPSIWSDPPTGSRGGPQKLYAVDYLPADLQLLIKTHRAEQFAQESTSDPLNAVLITNSRKRAPIRSANGNGSTAPAPFNPTTGEGLNKKESNRALLVSRLVSEYRVHYAGCTNGAVIKAKKNFIEQYNLGEGGILPAIYSTIGKTSFQNTSSQNTEVLAYSRLACACLHVLRRGFRVYTRTQESSLGVGNHANICPTPQHTI